MLLYCAETWKMAEGIQQALIALNESTTANIHFTNSPSKGEEDLSNKKTETQGYETTKNLRNAFLWQTKC